MKNQIEIGGIGRLGDLNIGDRFFFLLDGQTKEAARGIVTNIVPPHQEDDPADLVREVTFKLNGTLSFTVSGETRVQNRGPLLLPEKQKLTSLNRKPTPYSQILFPTNPELNV